jgi:hypothetical protein
VYWKGGADLSALTRPAGVHVRRKTAALSARAV